MYIVYTCTIYNCIFGPFLYNFCRPIFTICQQKCYHKQYILLSITLLYCIRNKLAYFLIKKKNELSKIQNAGSVIE